MRNSYHPLTRVGEAALGVSYLALGAVFARATLGSGRLPARDGALGTILRHPFGQGMLALIAIGFLAHAVTTLLRASHSPALRAEGSVLDRGRKLGFASALSHTALAAGTAELASWMRRHPARGGQTHWTTQLLDSGWGAPALLAVAAALGLLGIAQFVRARSTRLHEWLADRAVDPRRRHWLEIFARFGVVARGVAFTLAAGFLAFAALQPRWQGYGLRPAIRALQHSGMGAVLLGATSLGFLAFGAVMLVLGCAPRSAMELRGRASPYGVTA